MLIMQKSEIQVSDEIEKYFSQNLKTGKVMNDIKILDIVERYIKGEMNPDERLHLKIFVNQIRKLTN